MVLVDLDEIDALCRLHPLWSSSHRYPVEFRRSDYVGDPGVPLTEAVRTTVEQHTGHRPEGRIALLTNPRTWGWLFNPISCYYCYGPDGRVEHLLFEVTNTPWHERHSYVVGAPGVHMVAKALHVSPFLPMGMRYRMSYTAPGDVVDLHISASGDGGHGLLASAQLARHPLTRRALGRFLWRPTDGTLGVSAGIYRQALALLVKGTPVHRHPAPSATAAPPPPGDRSRA
jgi:DUF1365 family protein